ncbi:MAG: type II toxin-antitoxin system VapC family toxin [Planctomycetes bacterium]|nr:type II toxin-antitoxin system VapC family toxin [Planctomycetota bacterium]
MQYVLDTDMCVYLLSGDPRVKAKVAEVGIEAISAAIPTAAELYFGAYSSARVEANLARVRAFLSAPGFTVLPLDDAAAECFGRFKARLRQAGKPIGDIDILIAGVAASRGLKVVTNNTAHFARDGYRESSCPRSSRSPYGELAPARRGRRAEPLGIQKPVFSKKTGFSGSNMRIPDSRIARIPDVPLENWLKP